MTTTTDPTGAPTSVFDPSVRAVTVAVLTIVAIGAFEGLAVAAALPQVAADLGGVSLLPWVVSSYVMASGIATVVAGALVDRVGAAPTFRWTVVVLVVGALVCAAAPSMPVLVAARVVQGAGAGATNAVALAAVGLVYPQRLVSRAFAANTLVWGVMSVAGPAIAAGLLEVASWRWIFWVNLPLGLLALALGWRPLPQDPPPGAQRVRLSPVTLGLLAVFSVGTLVALDGLAWWSLPLIGIALLAGWAVMRRAEGRPDALIAPRHVLRSPFGPLAWTIGLLLTGGIGLQIYTPLYVEAGRGLSSRQAAFSVIFFVVGWTVGAQVASRLGERRSTVGVVTLGASVVAPAVLATAALMAVDAPLPAIFATILLVGVGLGLATNAGLTALREFAADAELGRAVAAHQYVRSQGFAGGPALAGGVLLLVVAARTGDVEAVRQLLGATGEAAGAAGAASAAVAEAVRAGFAWAFACCGVVALLAQLPLALVRRAARGS